MRTPARTLPDHCCSGAMRRAHATAQCKVSVQPTARHRSCLFCYTCVPAAAYRACSVAPRRQCATAADVVGAAVGIGGARPHATHLFCSMRLTPARMQTSIAADTPMCRRPPRLHRCCIMFRWAFVRSRYPPHFSTQRWVRLTMCGCGPIWSQACSTRRSAGGEDCLALEQRQATQCAPGAGFHLAFAATDASAVDAFHRAALQHGGRCNGAAGLRPDYGDDDYAAFVIDPDGHHIDAVVDRTPAR